MRLNKNKLKDFNSLIMKQYYIEHFLDDTDAALEIQVPFSSSISVLSWCFNIEQTKKYKIHLIIQKPTIIVDLCDLLRSIVSHTIQQFLKIY